MIDLTGYGFRVEARSPSTELITAKQVLTTCLKHHFVGMGGWILQQTSGHLLLGTLKMYGANHGRLRLEVRIYENGTVNAACLLSKDTVSGTDHTSFDWKGDCKIDFDLSQQAVPGFKDLLERVFSGCVKKVQEKLAKDPAKFERLGFAGLVKDWKA